MSDQLFERAVTDWLEDGSDRTPRSAIDGVLLAVKTTRQERDLRIPWRFTTMPALSRATGIAAVALVAAVGTAGLIYLNAGGPGAFGGPSTPAPTAQASPSNSPSQDATQPPLPLTFRPFAEPGDDPRDDTIQVTFDLPPSWERFDDVGALTLGNQPPNGAAVLFYRMNGLFSQPCRPAGDEAAADIPVGPTVDDFVTALVDHPSLDVTAPVDVTLAGYSGKYVVLTIPDDISECDRYRPLDGHLYAQGPGHRWHMWVLDVDGVRVVVESDDYAGTPAQRLAEAQAILDSLEITP
jgi:hypothetical protein